MDDPLAVLGGCLSAVLWLIAVVIVLAIFGALSH